MGFVSNEVNNNQHTINVSNNFIYVRNSYRSIKKRSRFNISMYTKLNLVYVLLNPV